MSVLRQLDLLVLAAGLVVCLAAGFSMLGYAVAAGVWLVARGIELAAERRAAGTIARGERRTALGTIAAATLARVFLIALAVLIVGLTDREAGLTAALLSAVLFTVHLGVQLVGHLVEPEGARR